MRKSPFIYLILLCILWGCTKYEEVIVPGNKAIPDKTIPEITFETYINKAYIAVLGRKPGAAEYSQSNTILKKNNLSVANRLEFLSSVFARPEYNDHIYQLARANLLNNLDTNETVQMIAILNMLSMDPQYAQFKDRITYEITRLVELRKIPVDLEKGVIDHTGMLRRCINNYFYDQINMGTANFVISSFQHFLLRYPTDAELEAAGNMVDGMNSIFFLGNGNSKDDFMNIFFSSDHYHEGLIRDAYNKYLFREPNSVEMADKTAKFKSSKSYVEMLKVLLSEDEYVGLK